MRRVEGCGLNVAACTAAVAGRPPYRLVVAIAVAVVSCACFGRVVSSGTIVANPGATVVVPVAVDDISDVGAAVLTVGYDPTVAVCLGAEAAGVADAKEFTYVDSGNGRVCAIVSGFVANNASGGGRGATALPSNALMTVSFSVRDGTAGLFSDVTLQDVQLGAKDGVSDLNVKNPLTTTNGMIRAVAADAAVERLENPFVVWPKTALKSLTLATGDAIKADADGMPITVSHGVSAAGAIPVEAPIGGWQTGSYAILATPTTGLAFALDGVTNVQFRTTVSSGITTYWADVAVEGEIAVASETGTLDKATVAEVREALADTLAANPEVTAITVKGETAQIPLIVDLGIGPHVDILGTTAVATYATPSISITEFDPDSGRVRIKVDPGTGNSIRATLATGCIHVYGTSDLGQKMRYISGTSIDLTPYLATETKGEADLTVSLGTHTFIKIKAETVIKQEGDTE